MGTISSTVRVSKNGTGGVTVTTQDIQMPVTSQGAQRIEFSLSVDSDVPNAPYKFPDDDDPNYPNNGINITDPGDEFDKYKKLESGDVKVRDKNDNTDDYTYTITILDANGTAFTSDPSIRNGGTN